MPQIWKNREGGVPKYAERFDDCLLADMQRHKVVMNRGFASHMIVACYPTNVTSV
jgi:hypothetical protein